MDWESAYVIVDTTMTMECVRQGNHVLLTAQEILQDHALVSQDILYMENSVLDAQMDRFGWPMKIDVLFLAELMNNSTINQRYVNVKKDMANSRALVRYALLTSS